eukprot:c24677_g1_i1 orf=215-1231(-)
MAMACSSSSDNSPTSSYTSSSMSDENSEETVDDSFWSSLARRAKTVLEDPSLDIKSKDSKPLQRKHVSNALIPQNKDNGTLSEGKWKQQESLGLHKGLEAIASSLSLLSDTLGNALEEGLNLVETKATNFIYTESRSRSLKVSLDSVFPEKRLTNPTKLQVKPEDKPPKCQVKSEEKPGVTKDTQLKASRDVAMAMATKAKLLLRELKGVKTDLAFTKARCTQLEEENNWLRESVDKGAKDEEDDLVRLQLEALLAEKARLAQENAAYARENQFLHEVVQYHQLKLRDMGFANESLMMDDEGSLDASAVDMDFLPLYPEEKDIIALEESVKIASQHMI